ncbi:MAG: HAD-IA family hydrolase [Gammaproteobacteria bacterium]|nr:HAD-IA family hydrolase [Gammaproteobacteria bacterium]
MIVGSLIAIFIATCVLIVWYFTFHQEGYQGSLDLPQQKLIVFDFDGTLCDSLHTAIREFNALSTQWRLNPITDVNELRNLSSLQALRRHGVSWWKLPMLKHKLVKAIVPHIIKMKLPIGMLEVLCELKKSGFKLGILTSNSYENTRQFLEHHQISVFEFIYFGSAIFGKARLLKKIKLKAKCSEIFYVGDESRDIDAANKINIPSIAVTWGYHSEKLLSEHQPIYTAKSPADLLVILEKKCFGS